MPLPVTPPYGGASPTTTAGVATITAASSTVTVTHGLPSTPTSVTVTPASEARVWVTAIGATTFVINRIGPVGALPIPTFGRTGDVAALTVYWSADV